MTTLYVRESLVCPLGLIEKLVVASLPTVRNSYRPSGGLALSLGLPALSPDMGEDHSAL